VRSLVVGSISPRQLRFVVVVKTLACGSLQQQWQQPQCSARRLMPLLLSVVQR
jgi:hypothetical protein